MDLYLRRVIHPQAHDNYRVIMKDGDEEIEIGSIGIQHAAGSRLFWAWGLDAVVPMQGLQERGTGLGTTTVCDCSGRRGSASVQTRRAWHSFLR